MLLIVYWRTRKKPILYGLFAFWTLVPPMWFVFDFYVLFKRFGAQDSFDMLKYGERISERLWAAVLALIGLILLKETKTPRASGD